MSQLSALTLLIETLARGIPRKQILRMSVLLIVAAMVLVDVPSPAGSDVFNPAANPCLGRSGKIMQTPLPSAVYAQPVPVSIYLPPCYESSTNLLPVIYLLHGGNADETQWPDLNLQSAADALIANGAQPFVVVMPGGDYRAGIDYAAFVLNDLLPATSNQLQIRTDAAGRAIGGISLGGYWALTVAFRHPEEFAAVGGFSPVIASSSDDLAAFARTAAGLDSLRIQLDIGDADALVAATQRLAATLQARGLNVSFTINRGGHNRPYWRTRTSAFLSFMLASFTSPTPRLKCHAES